ncbi:MAG: HAD-IIB family hydrolase [Thiolinea sp.]
MSKSYIVFTDLDGTLLDHHTYSHTAAQAALDKLQQLKIPVVLNSSKTPAEIEAIARDLQLDSPRIAENGSVIAFPDGEMLKLGSDYPTICRVLNQLREQEHYQFTGFHDGTAEAIAGLTGLSPEAAQRAGERQASEPLLWQDDEEKLEQFRQQLAEHGLALKRGGRFWHVMGQADKVQAMQYLVNSYQQDKADGQPLTVIALGDGPNDRDMLAAADIAVIVHNPDGKALDLPECSGQQLIRTTLPGPAGWNAAMLQILENEATNQR